MRPYFNYKLNFLNDDVIVSSCLRLSMMASLFIFLFFTNKLHAQTISMKVFAITPEWNGQTFCDAGSGFDAASINAPSMSYSGANIQEASYNYAWQQKINDENWQDVATAKAVGFVPSYNPPLLFSKAGSPPQKISYRLVLRDVANGDKEIMTEEFSFNLVSDVEVTHTVSPKDVKNKLDINLSVKGGSNEVKKFTWASVNKATDFPKDQKNVEDPKGLSNGIYMVTIQDAVCPKKEFSINTTTVINN